MAYSFSKDTGLKLRRLARLEPSRETPNNKPNEQEEQLLYAVQKNHPRVGDHIVEQQLADSRGVRVMLPLFYSKQCLACHGNPRDELTSPGIKGRLQGRRLRRPFLLCCLLKKLTRAALICRIRQSTQWYQSAVDQLTRIAAAIQRQEHSI